MEGYSSVTRVPYSYRYDWHRSDSDWAARIFVNKKVARLAFDENQERCPLKIAFSFTVRSV